jgi:replicative DNA helicase
VDDTASLSIFELRTKARRLVKEHKIECIVIDYLQLMNASGMKTGNRQEEVAIISRGLKGLAKELNIPIIALSQLNRAVDIRSSTDKSAQSGGSKPQLSDLRESGSIEQDADIVCFIHRPEKYGLLEDSRGNSLRGKAEIIIAKHRNGATGEVLLSFKQELVRFQNLEDDIVVHEFASKAGNGKGQTIAPPAPISAADGATDGAEYPF